MSPAQRAQPARPTERPAGAPPPAGFPWPRIVLPHGWERALAVSWGSGAAAAAALALSPAWEAVPPVVLPYLPIDLRFFAVAGVFPLVHLFMRWAKWPTPAMALPSLALLFAVATHWQGSAILGLFTPLEAAQPGQRVQLLRGLLTGASLLLALMAMMDRGRARAEHLVREAGLPEDQIRVLRKVADAHAAKVIGFTGASFVALLLVALVSDGWVGAERAPLPELLGAALAVGVAVLLFPGAVGLGARRADR